MSTKTTTAEETIAPIATATPTNEGAFSIADLAAPVFSEELANESLCIDNEADVPALPPVLAQLPNVKHGAFDALNGNPTFTALKKLCAVATNKNEPQTIVTSIGKIDFNRGASRSDLSWSLTDFRTKKNPTQARLKNIEILKAVAVPGLSIKQLKDSSSRNLVKGQGQLMSHITTLALLRSTSSWHSFTTVEQAHYFNRAHTNADAVICYPFGTSLEGVCLATAMTIAGGSNLFTVSIYNGFATALDLGLITLPEGILAEDAPQPSVWKIPVVKNPFATLTMEA